MEENLIMKYSERLAVDIEALCQTLSIENEEIFLERIFTLKSLFHLNDEETIRFFKNSDLYLTLSEAELKKRIDDLSLILDCTVQEMIDVLLIYPSIINYTKGLVLSRATRLSDYFSCSEDDVFKMYKEYPLSMSYTPSKIDFILRYKRYRTDKIKNFVRQYPWILECISRAENMEYSGFLSLEQLISCSQFINTHFGSVIRVYQRKKRWNDKNINRITFLLVKDSFNQYYLLALGSISPIERLLRAIFPMERSYDIFYMRISDNQIFDLSLYFQYMSIGMSQERRGVQLKTGFTLCRFPALEFTFNRYSEFQFQIDEKNFVTFHHIVILNEDFSKKHQAYYKKKDSSRNKNENLEEIDFNFNVANENFVDDNDDVMSIFDEDSKSGFEPLSNDNKDEDEDNQTNRDFPDPLLDEDTKKELDEYVYEVFGSYENMIKFLKSSTYV